MTRNAERTIRGVLIVLLLYIFESRADRLQLATSSADLLVSYLVAMTEAQR